MAALITKTKEKQYIAVAFLWLMTCSVYQILNLVPRVLSFSSPGAALAPGVGRREILGTRLRKYCKVCEVCIQYAYIEKRYIFVLSFQGSQ